MTPKSRMGSARGLAWMGAFVAAILLAGCVAGSMVGKQAPAVTPKYLNHKDDAPPKLLGHVYLVEFWATWCPPCRQSIPHLNKIWDKYHDQGLQIIGISQEQPSEITSFFGKTEMKYFVGYDADGTLHDKYRIRGIPHAFLVNKDGMIIWDGHPLALDEKEIDKALKEK